LEHDALLKPSRSSDFLQRAQEFSQVISQLISPVTAIEDTLMARSSNAERARFTLFDLVATLLRSVTAYRPLMLIMEDLHDADQPSLQMLRFVVSQLKDARSLVLGTYRDVELRRSAEVSRLIGDLIRQGTEMPLSAFSWHDTEGMIEKRAGAPTNPRLVSDIHQATSGNPLFIDGLLRVLAADGPLTSASRLNLTACKVPHGVSEAIRHWLDLIPHRATLAAAALIGPEFDLRCLQRVTQMTVVQLTDELREAARVGIVTASSDGVYKFSHALMRTALCDELTSADRATLHLKIGQALEELEGAEIGVGAPALHMRYQSSRLQQEDVETAPLTAEFRRQGEYWTLSSWAGTESRLKHRKGFCYIARLLRHPGQEFAATDLSAAIETATNASAPVALNAGEAHRSHFTIARGLGDAGAALDAIAKAQYKRRLRDLREELDRAERYNDIGRREKVQDEIEFIQAEVAAAVGLAGRDRRSASHAERARLAVTKAIKASINRISDADPELARHLSLSIQTGHFCTYDPKQPVTWQLQSPGVRFVPCQGTVVPRFVTPDYLTGTEY
jgi:hypothetical protein